MTRDREERRVVLIFGSPGSGKSTLGERLRDEHSYHLVQLDKVYVEFVKSRYPDLYLPMLNHVIAQHYETMLTRLDATGIMPGSVAAWRDHVASLAKAASEAHELVSIEGYLLAPVLRAVQERLAGVATVTTVEARSRQYFIAGSIEHILGSSDDA